METTDEESSSTGHTETTVDSKVSPSVRVTLQTPAQVGFAFALLTLDSGSDTVTDK